MVYPEHTVDTYQYFLATHSNLMITSRSLKSLRRSGPKWGLTAVRLWLKCSTLIFVDEIVFYSYTFLRIHAVSEEVNLDYLGSIGISSPIH